MKNLHLILICVAVAIVGFVGGMYYGKNKTQQNTQSAFTGGARGGRAMRGGAAAGNGLVAGEVISKDDKSVTIKDRTGGSKIIFIGATTQYKKTADGTLADIAIGKQISVTGDTGSDGTVVAQLIQLRPDMVATSTPVK